jgi:50S ribosomal subunit-associated GTPase HflX
MVLPEDSSNPIVEALNKINESLEENNDVLNRIAKHYDSVVPVMKRNADRVEEVQTEQDKTFPEQMRSIFAS